MSVHSPSLDASFWITLSCIEIITTTKVVVCTSPRRVFYQLPLKRH